MDFLDLETFISEHVINRSQSYFQADLIENADKLSREIKDKSFLVIGGAGTIGSNFIKAILNYNPSKVIVVDTNENGLTELVRDLRSQHKIEMPEVFITYPVDYGLPVFQKLFYNKGPFDVIANFAAHKHVRSEKDIFSIEAMFRNNVFSVDQLCRLASISPPAHFFCVSTDKAANPVNVMGASKKVMEEVLMSYTKQLPISTARFANVAFSNGSLLQGFVERILKRQPLSAPRDVRRYFVSPIESGQLCMLACMLGKAGQVFYPKLKPDQMKTFSSIANLFLKEMGLQPLETDSEHEARALASSETLSKGVYPVYYFDTETSGEKPFEEFVADNETAHEDQYQGLGFINYTNSYTANKRDEMLKELRLTFDNAKSRKSDVIATVSKFIKTFNHIETNKNLDQKM